MADVSGNAKYKTALTATGATSGQNGANQDNLRAKGVVIVVDITAITAGSVTVTLQGYDDASGKYYTILASAALAAVATTVLRVYPGMVAAANLVASDMLPKTWRVITAVATGPATYTVGVNLIP